MIKKYVLGIETSCDETAAAVVGYDLKMLSNVILSQIDIHKEFGGVVPEVAARNHIKVIDKVVDSAIRQASETVYKSRVSKLNTGSKVVDELNNKTFSFPDLFCIAATGKPGLPGAVMVGRVMGDCLATAVGVPFTEVNHILGHIASVPLSVANFGQDNAILPLKHVALVVSGGHTALYDVSLKGVVALIETTMDDAVGEAFDKVARTLGLSYPGGPSIEAEAKKYKGTEFVKFVAHPNYTREGFSYSGLKTAVLNYINRLKQKDETIDIPMIAASFQIEAIAQLVIKCERLIAKKGIESLYVSGGVSANTLLREELGRVALERGINIVFPQKSLSGDNAAMIAAASILGLKMKN